MSQLIKPEGYKAVLGKRQTEQGIKLILIWYPILERSIELSSMGAVWIRQPYFVSYRLRSKKNVSNSSFISSYSLTSYRYVLVVVLGRAVFV